MKYYAKYPNEPFEARRGNFRRTITAAKRQIEDDARHTNKPWIQLVREDANGWEVVAEYRNHGRPGWVGALVAAGMEAAQ